MLGEISIFLSSFPRLPGGVLRAVEEEDEDKEGEGRGVGEDAPLSLSCLC